MNAFDIALLALACVLVLVGVVKGLVRIVVGLAALLAAFALAARFHEGLAAGLRSLDIGMDWLRLIAYLMIFLGVMLVGSVIAHLTRRLLKAAMLGWADRLGGAALGLLAALLVAALIVLPLIAYLPSGERLLADSVLAPYVAAVCDVADRVVPPSLSSRYRERVEDLRRLWRERYLEGTRSSAPEV